MESTANMTSAVPMAMMHRSIGVIMVRPAWRWITLPPTKPSVMGTTRETSLTKPLGRYSSAPCSSGRWTPSRAWATAV